MNQYYTVYPDELYHHGIKNQKWGQRRFQNYDGTLTEEGMIRYGRGQSKRKNKSIFGFNLKNNTDLYLQNIISIDVYKTRDNEIDKKIQELNKKLQNQAKEKNKDDSLAKAISKTKEIIKNDDYDDNIIKQLLEKIVIIDENNAEHEVEIS